MGSSVVGNIQSFAATPRNGLITVMLIQTKNSPPPHPLPVKKCTQDLAEGIEAKLFLVWFGHGNGESRTLHQSIKVVVSGK